MALVLTRKTHQAVVIKVRGEEIRITLACIQPESVQLAFDASDNVLILREEVKDRNEL